MTNVEVEAVCKTLSDDVSHVVSHRRIHALRPGKVREFYFTMSPEKLSGSRFSVKFSSSNGTFTVNAYDPDDEGDNGDDGSSGTNLGSSGSGCNISAGLLAMSLAAILMIRRR
ncbi:MAG: hypothetical protein IJT58_06505 [Synergistaceae bacterium]|nr:hypothetical protein [Synergistaceae bacterium]